ncbi:glucose-6-phosphate isomerase, partial [Candidatus Pelagibacter sp.]|nr:glucose-6-phosphate isomerase [Candidatus Pelagibacter sp.]
QNIRKSNKKCLNIIVSKSGNTLETISNFNLILTKQKKNKNLIITENKKNILRSLAHKLKSDVLDHKNYIGGRYSVLSEVGMVPAELMGLNEKKFKRLNYLIKNKKFVNFLIQNVSSIHSNIIKGKKNCVILNYDEKLNNFLKWYQQLSAESLGKKGKGFFPIISTMPKDNHSLLQLYLDGTKNNFFSFFSSKEKSYYKFNNTYLIDRLEHLNRKSLDQVLYAQKKATQNVFNKKKLPFRCFEIINKSEETLGELFTFFILETLMLSSLLDVNPINQPSVELIKIETQKILK